MGIFRPRYKILGQEFSGDIEEVGKNVNQFKKGDPVFVATNFKMGGYAEYNCLKATPGVMLKPATISYEDAATIPTGGINGLHFTKKANIQPGEKVLINGAGGSIGTYAVQLAKLSGAEVTAVDSTSKLEMLLSIGADHVIDYTKEDAFSSINKYDVVIDIVRTRSLLKKMRVLKNNGRYVLCNPEFGYVLLGLWKKMTGSKKIINALAGYKTEDIIYIIELLETKKIRIVIDKRFPLEQMQEAHRYVEKGLKAGNLIITVADS